MRGMWMGLVAGAMALAVTTVVFAADVKVTVDVNTTNAPASTNVVVVTNAPAE